MHADGATGQVDVAIIGGGPAGQAAAAATTSAGLSTAIIDEQQRPGGQIMRQPPAGFSVPHWQGARAYAGLRAQLERTEANRAILWMGGTSVLGLWPSPNGWRLSLLDASGVRQIAATRVLVAAGCYDIPAPLPGWTLPGVTSAGAVQAFLKSQQVISGRRFVLFGTHPLQLIVAEQLVAAGASVEALLFAQSFGALAGLLRGHLPAVATHAGPLLQAASAYLSIRRAGVPVRFGASVQRIVGTDRVESVEAAVNGESITFPCDAAAMCFGFMPQSDLIRAAGAAVRWAEPAGGWEAIHDDWMRSSLPNLYVAGETTGVAGAEASLIEGSIAGVAIVHDAGLLGSAQAAARFLSARRARGRLGPFVEMLRALADPRLWLPALEPETLICRCEDVTARQVDAAIAETVEAPAAAGPVKLLCRAGMGLCQGRSCEHSVIRRIAASRLCQPEEVHGFTARFPARPIPLSDLID